MVSTPALFLAAMAAAEPKQDAVTAADLKSIAGHLGRHQEADGSWAWSAAPAKNRPPPVMESDEVATLWGLLDLGPADPKEKSDVRDKALAWLAKATPTDTTQAAALRLWLRVREGKSTTDEVQSLLKRQNKDGGWSPVAGIPGDGYATGQALYVLNLAGVPNDHPDVKRAVAFLVSTQKDDGSWPMKSRSHPGAEPMKNPVPITYFGSAWATLGLLRTVPKERTSSGTTAK
jgi:squalene-hopene/tetraprenyl-beta-curcumene cyclase